jgi:hypothetical protein
MCCGDPFLDGEVAEISAKNPENTELFIDDMCPESKDS